MLPLSDWSRRLATGVSRWTPWVVIVVAIVSHYVLGPECFSPTCSPEASHPTAATFVLAACIVVFVIWLLWWLADQISRAREDRR